MYDLVIIGAGPAGMTAAVYAARKKLRTIIITERFGGQPVETQGIENYMGFQYITGIELMAKFEEQMKHYTIEDISARVVGIKKNGVNFDVHTREQVYETKTVIIASGKNPRRLQVPGEKEFAGKGVSYCATCDGPIFADQDVAVIGGGNSALQSAQDLSRIAKNVYLISRGELIADPVTIEKMRNIANIEIFTGYNTKEIKGGKFVENMTILPQSGGQAKEIPVSGVFIEIGLIPNSDFAAGLVKENEKGEILVNCSCQTNIPGIFAAGDVTNAPEKQIVIAAGDGAKAAIAAYKYLFD
jgi:NADH-dependent peroxiredoxin subunit F